MQYWSYWPPLIAADYKHCNTKAKNTTDPIRLQALQHWSYWPPLIPPDYKHCNTKATDTLIPPNYKHCSTEATSRHWSHRTTTTQILKLLAATDPTELQALQHWSYWPLLIPPDYNHSNTEPTSRHLSDRTTSTAVVKLPDKLSGPD